MSKKVTVLGVRLDCYSLRGAIGHASKFLNNMTVNVVQMVSLKTINAAADNEAIKDYLENVDLSVINDVQVIRAADEKLKGRIKEVEEGFFLKAFLKRIRDNKKSVCILAASEEDGAKFHDYVRNEGIDLNVVGVFVADPSAENFNWETIANDINSKNVGGVISLLDVTLNEEFLREFKSMLSIEVFFGLGDEPEATRNTKGVFAGLKRRVFKRIINRKVNKNNE
ncbi:MAG: hypothetical protein E7241_06525 [Lachnospiraceae bacterium]|jgi:UDP-N-acetyl-D-mannosaminuronic acid transferase (WecB/TagA/CpsF family)|nr:hypothetical protein [Lachnospiraceae bacterium]